MEHQMNVAANLLQQALTTMISSLYTPTVDYDRIVHTAMEVVKKEKQKVFDKVLLTQHEAQETYGKSVIKALVKRGFLQQYRFDTREAIDREGNPVTKAKGTIYYRMAEIEKAIEDGNILKGTRRKTI